jgi:hypothetical protein
MKFRRRGKPYQLHLPDAACGGIVIQKKMAPGICIPQRALGNFHQQFGRTRKTYESGSYQYIVPKDSPRVGTDDGISPFMVQCNILAELHLVLEENPIKSGAKEMPLFRNPRVPDPWREQPVDEDYRGRDHGCRNSELDRVVQSIKASLRDTRNPRVAYR